MKTYILSFFLFLPFALLLSCGDDTTTNTVTTPPPTHEDSVIMLFSPEDSSHFYYGDTIRFTWSKGFAPKFYFSYYVDPGGSSVDTYTDTSWTWIVDSVSAGGVISYSWKIRPSHWQNGGCSDCFQYQSEQRIIFFN